MRFGVFDHVDRGAGAIEGFYDRRLQIVERYDQAGLYAYHVAEHHGTPLGMAPSPSVYLAAVAQRTTRLRFGPMVYCLPLYHPLRLLEEICMLDQMSGGRLELGVGRGISPIEAGFFGIAADDAQAQYQEGLDFIRKGLAARDFTFEGDYFSVTGYPAVLRCVQRPHPPLWYGVARPDSADWAADNAVNIICNQSAETVRKVVDRYRSRWRASDRAPQKLPLIGMNRHVVIGESGSEARDAARQAYRHWLDAFMTLWRRHGLTPKTVSFPETFDELMAAGLGVAGTIAEVRNFVWRQIEDTGVNYFVGRFAFGDLDTEQACRSVDLFANEVMPAFAKAA